MCEKKINHYNFIFIITNKSRGGLRGSEGTGCDSNQGFKLTNDPCNYIHTNENI